MTILLHRIGPRISSNWNDISEILACNEPISFDGCYSEVYAHHKMLKGKDVTFFVSGKFLGKTNEFDWSSGENPGVFCTLDQIFEMRDYLNAKVCYHGWAHLNCTLLTDDQVRAEISPPDWLSHRILAYPYGNVDKRVAKIVEDMGYIEAYSVHQGDGSQFQKKRSYLNW